MNRTIILEWNATRPQGRLAITHGKFKRIAIERGKGRITGAAFAFSNAGSHRLRITIEDTQTDPGHSPTIVTVRERKQPFSFFLRDVKAGRPILLPMFGVAITDASDSRSRDAIARAIPQPGRQTYLQQVESETEENYKQAATNTRPQTCPTWLGLSRDFRIFHLGFRDMQERWDWIQPRFNWKEIKTPEMDGKEPKHGFEKCLKYGFMMGRGFGCTNKLTRRLEDGVLPILHATLIDGDVTYQTTVFVTLEFQSLTARNLRGTHYLVADGHGAGTRFTPEQQKQYDALLPKELGREDEAILCYQVKAINTGRAPRYAWFHALDACSTFYRVPTEPINAKGFATFPSGRVFGVNKLNGKPLRHRENCLLLEPGEIATFEFYVPHRPISKARATRLAKFDFAVKHAEAREFWLRKLGSGAQVRLPERRIEEMTRAGLLHIDLNTYGLEPSGTLIPMNGCYTAIGSESSPMIQFLDSMGWHYVARRALQFFFDKQHANGFMQNFYTYMLETGAILWTAGEHYRYTRDDAWVRRLMPKLLKSCDYLIRWRERNKKSELRGKGFGMIEGKVADPDDPFHSYMLNGFAYLGLARVAEMLNRIAPAQSKRLWKEARSFKKDIRDSFFESVANSPVVPLGNGMWCPSAPPWAEAVHGPVCLYPSDDAVYTHGTFLCRDSLLGPLWLVFQEILGAREPATGWWLNAHAELMTDRNVAFSQPYYSRHDWAHLARGEVKAFLKSYYNGFAGMADRETYTFWEHFFGASPHKTHEEAWFLMQTRWMLYREEGKTLKLLPAIPRSWLASGKTIELEKAASYFGPLSLRVESKLDQGKIEAWIECRSNRQPNTIELRLPHPHRAAARKIVGGTYQHGNETVLISHFKNTARVCLTF